MAGYTYRRLFDIDKGLAKDKKLFVEGENGKYDAAAFVQRWVDYQVGEATGKSMGLEEAKAVHEQVKIEKTRLEVARMQGELIDVNEVRTTAAALRDVTTTLNTLTPFSAEQADTHVTITFDSDEGDDFAG